MEINEFERNDVSKLGAILALSNNHDCNEMNEFKNDQIE